MSDIVEKLRGRARRPPHCETTEICNQAADEIERLRKEVDRMMGLDPETCEHDVRIGDWCEPCNEAYKEAAADPENHVP